MPKLSNKTGKSVSVVIPVKNEVDYIGNCIKSILDQSYADIIEVIVVDGSSTDGTRKVVKKLKRRNERIKLLTDPGTSMGLARNIGISKAKGEIIAFTNADELPEEKWVENLVRNFESEDVGGIFGKVELKETKGFLSEWAQIDLEKHFSPFEKGDPGRKVAMSNVAYRKDVIKKVGMFDPKLKDSDDCDISWRISKNYDILYEPNAIVYHQKANEEEFKSLFRVTASVGFGYGQLLRKHGINFSPKMLFLALIPPIWLFFLGLSHFFLTEYLTLSLLISTFAIISAYSIKDLVSFQKKGAILNLILLPSRLIVHSLALLAGFFYQAFSAEM